MVAGRLSDGDSIPRTPSHPNSSPGSASLMGPPPRPSGSAPHRPRRSRPPSARARSRPRCPGVPHDPDPSDAEHRGRHVRQRGQVAGPDRALLYLVLVQTGLWIGELAEVRVRDVRLEGEVFRIELPARVGKNRREANIPLRRDLVDALRPRLDGKAPAAAVFDVPSSLIARFNADCKRAGIPKRDDRDRTVDIHSLRKTFNTWLALAGVAPRIAQELLRHQNINVTMGVYTDTGLFNLADSVESLPMMQFSMQCPGAPEGSTEFTDVHSGDEAPGDETPS